MLFPVQVALMHPNGGALTSEMLNPLLRAVPLPKEVEDIRLYLAVIHTLPSASHHFLQIMPSFLTTCT